MTKLQGIAFALALCLVPAPAALAADKCPPEVAQAKSMLAKARAAAKTTARGQATQASRQLAASKSQDVQAPRSQDTQAPRSQDTQAPRSQDNTQARRLGNAQKLIRGAEAACKKGDMALSAEKAKAAMELLK